MFVGASKSVVKCDKLSAARVSFQGRVCKPPGLMGIE